MVATVETPPPPAATAPGRSPFRRRPNPTGGPGSPLGRAVAVLALIVVDIVVIRSVKSFFDEGTWFLGIAVLVVLAGAHVIVLVRRFTAMRWLAPGLGLLVLFTLAPMAYTTYLGFTNASSDHQLTKAQAIKSLEVDTFLPDGSASYKWAAYQKVSDKSYALWLVPESGDNLFATVGSAPKTATAGSDGYGAAGTDGFPSSIDGYTRIQRAASVVRIQALSKLNFGDSAHPIRIASLDKAGVFTQRYTYDGKSDTLTDHKDNITYRPQHGTFTSDAGKTISPSFQAPIGFGNFTKLFSNKLIRTPALRIFIWTVIYAVVVVGVQFVVGLALALALNDRAIPRRLSRAIRSVLLLPYATPAYLTILVWAGMLNQNLGIIPRWTHTLFGLNPNWVDTPNGAKIAVLLVAIWLGFPYFLLITSGALQAIPTELLEAAEVDGASTVARFRTVVFPLLMRMVGPLIVLGLAFNFNNFLVVYLLKQGGPPMADSQVPAGNTDLLISFTYRLSFDFGAGADYGLAAVMTMIIFAVLVPVVVSQFRYYQVWAEES